MGNERGGLDFLLGDDLDAPRRVDDIDRCAVNRADVVVPGENRLLVGGHERFRHHDLSGAGIDQRRRRGRRWGRGRIGCRIGCGAPLLQGIGSVGQKRLIAQDILQRLVRGAIAECVPASRPVPLHRIPVPGSGASGETAAPRIRIPAAQGGSGLHRGVGRPQRHRKAREEHSQHKAQKPSDIDTPNRTYDAAIPPHRSTLPDSLLPKLLRPPVFTSRRVPSSRNRTAAAVVGGRYSIARPEWNRLLQCRYISVTVHCHFRDDFITNPWQMCDIPHARGSSRAAGIVIRNPIGDTA
ncbi:protein of unknown function [Methylacidimicrobium sp. AP8]|nr:protein of unknown function [Methylacidimicrobium sp. AP8]